MQEGPALRPEAEIPGSLPQSVFVVSEFRNFSTVPRGILTFRRSSICFPHFHVHLFPVSFSSLREPFTHGLSQPGRIHARPGLEPSFASRQRIVEFRRTREISHAKIVEPIERRSPALPVNHNINSQFSRVQLRFPRLSKATVLDLRISIFGLSAAAERQLL